jgi:hypothetical protein
MTISPRWQRLADDLTAAGIKDVKITTHAGGGCSMSWIRADWQMVAVHDKWWSKNPGVWLGWQVHIEGRDSLVKRTWALSKKRSVVTANVVKALS